MRALDFKQAARSNRARVRFLVLWYWKICKGQRLQIFLNTLIGLLLVATDLSFVWGTKQVIDIATGIRNDASLIAFLSLLGGIIVVQLSLGFFSKWVRAVLGVKAVNRMQARLFSHLLLSEWRELRAYHTGDLLNRVEKDVSDVVNFITESLPAFVTTLARLAGAFLLLFWMDRTLAVIIVLILPFFVLISRLYVGRMRRLTHDIRDSESKIQSMLQESLQHALVIKTLESEASALNKLTALQGQLQSETISKTRFASASSLLMNAGFALGYLVTFSWGTLSLASGTISYGALLAFIQLVGQIQAPIRTLTRFISVFITAFTAGERLIELERISPEKSGTPSLQKSASAMGIRFSGVTFSYAPGSRPIFQDFSYCFPPRSVTAIVGETGSGKTTLIRLLLSLMPPVSGSISLYDGQASQAVGPAARCNFSYTPQGNTLLSGTIRANLLLANPSASEPEIAEALQIAAADFVFSLPEGIDSHCGEMGDGFSEGQAQRLCIARSLLHKAPIFLFDEATSALDAETEERVIANIVHHFRSKTLIFVTHRPAILKYCTQTLHLGKS